MHAKVLHIEIFKQENKKNKKWTNNKQECITFCKINNNKMVKTKATNIQVNRIKYTQGIKLCSKAMIKTTSHAVIYIYLYIFLCVLGLKT